MEENKDKIELFINDRKITARKILVEDLPAVGAAIDPFIDKFDAMAENGKISPEKIISLCLKHSQDFERLILVMTDADASWLSKQDPQDFYNLCAAVIEISRDFFLTKCESGIVGIVKNLNKATLTMIFQQFTMSLNGQSNVLSQLDTDEQTS